MNNVFLNSIKNFISSKRTQLIILIMTIVLANSIFILWYFPENFKQSSLKRAEIETINISRITQHAVAPAVYFDDGDNINNALIATIKLPNFKSLIIFDKDFNVKRRFNERNLQKFHKKEGVEYNYDSSFINCTLPIVNENEHIGYMILKLSLDNIKKEVHEAQLNALIISIVSLIIGIIFTILISRIFTNPLQQLKSVFSEIARMNLGKRAYIPGNNEFTSLAESFNLMVDKLDKAYSEISEININLEKRVEERTVSLYDEIETRKLAQTNLLKINQLMTEIINASPLPILSIDSSGYIKSFCPAYSNLFGSNADQAIDTHPNFKNMYELNKYFEAINFAISERKPQLFSSILLTNTREEKNIQCHISPIINSDSNEATSLIIIMEDITDRIIKEQALLESEEKYRTLIDTSQIGIGIFRADTCIFANDSLLKIWGFNTLSELQKAKPVEYIVMNNTELIELFDKNIAINQKIELQYKNKNGTTGYVEATKTPITYLNESLIQIAFLDISDRIKNAEAVRILNQELEQRVLDRTAMLNDTLIELKNENIERQKVEEKLRLSDQILQRVGTLVLVADKDTNIIYVSPYVKTLLGYEVEEIIGDKWWDITSKNTQDKAKQREYIYKCINEEILPNEKPYERSIYTKDGSKKWIQWQDVMGDANTVIGVGNDITERTIAAQKLKEAGIELEKTLERERELGELKTKFISMISHEYRTPLTVILSSANIIAKLIERKETDKTHSFIKKIEFSVQSMVKLLEDVLIIGKSEVGAFKVELSVLNLEFIINDIIEDLKSAHKYSNEISLTYNGNFSSITSDEKLMRQILSNIISNALKYSPNNTLVSIELTLNPEFYVIEVTDSGIGISEQDLTHLFDSFYRGNNVGTISGTGLGMPILKRCVDMLNGTIDVQSKLNEGTKFRITLPNFKN